MATYNAKGEILNTHYYNCQDYGVVPSSLDNTQAMQSLIDLVYANGGGIIWIPNGVYFFDAEKSNRNLNANMNILLEMKKRVSLFGESLDHSIFKVTGTTENGTTLFGQHSVTAGEELTGATYCNFTVDMSEASLVTYSPKGKAFHYSGIRDCVFRDLRLIGTPSTSLGIDMLDNVVMDSIYVYQGGRQWTTGGAGGAGIGIGTGKWTNENYIIRNCVCDACGHFGIFLEDQGIFDTTKTQNYPKGQIIANNIIRNGRHYGLGIRGGKNVLFTGNNLYENVGGIYADYGAKNIVISNNLIQGCTDAGLLFGNEDQVVNGAESSLACENFAVVNNAFIENAVGIKKITAPLNSSVDSNVMLSNTTGEA